MAHAWEVYQFIAGIIGALTGRRPVAARTDEIPTPSTESTRIMTLPAIAPDLDGGGSDPPSPCRDDEAMRAAGRLLGLPTNERQTA